MKISIDGIPQSPKEIAFSESVEGLNKIYSQSSVREFGFPASLEVELRYYRAAADLFFDGRVSGELSGVCGRCAEGYRFRLDHDFDFALKPFGEEQAEFFVFALSVTLHAIAGQRSGKRIHDN